MKIKLVPFLICSFFLVSFLIFYKGLDKSNFYEPKSNLKEIPEFTSFTLFEKKKINSKNIFDKDRFYLVNIWASWCVPCKDEHSLLMNLSQNNQLYLIGINYKDKKSNAEKFIYELGNPYKKILIDMDGTLSIEWGAFGVPETFLIYNNEILKRFIGPINKQSIEEIKKLIK